MWVGGAIRKSQQSILHTKYSCKEDETQNFKYSYVRSYSHDIAIDTIRNVTQLNTFMQSTINNNCNLKFQGSGSVQSLYRSSNLKPATWMWLQCTYVDKEFAYASNNNACQSWINILSLSSVVLP